LTSAIPETAGSIAGLPEAIQTTLEPIPFPWQGNVGFGQNLINRTAQRRGIAAEDDPFISVAPRLNPTDAKALMAGQC
jgi:hypothetical protein